MTHNSMTEGASPSVASPSGKPHLHTFLYYGHTCACTSVRVRARVEHLFSILKY